MAGSRVTSYAGVRAHLRATAAWSSANSVFGGSRPHPEFPALISLDGARHDRIRVVVAEVLERPSALKIARDVIEPLVRRLVENALRQGTADAVGDVARPIAAAAVGAVLGVEAPRWLPAATETVAAAMGVQDEPWAADRRRAYDAVLKRMHAFFFRQLMQAERFPGSTGALARLHHGVRAGELTREEAVANLVLLAIAGSETTVGLLAAVVRWFALAPGLHACLGADASARVRFIEEVARLESPSGAFFRLSNDGRPREARLLSLADANRDPIAFPDPAALNLERGRPQHLAFGWGVHHCPGATLARAQALSLLEELLRRQVELAPLDAESPLRDFALIRQPARARYEWRTRTSCVEGGEPLPTTSA